MNINELREKRAKAWETTKSFLESNRTDKGTITAEDENTYNNMMADIDGLGKEIKRLEKQELLDKELAKAVNVPITGKPGFGGEEEKLKPVRARNGYAKDLIKAMRSNFKQVTNLLQEGVDADGGYLVPEEYDKRIIDTLEEENIMRKLGTKITTSGQHKINIAAAKPAAAWIEEGGTLTFGDAKFAQTLLDAHKLHVAIKVTEELLYDNAFNLESYIIDQFGKAIGNAEEDAFLNGDGKSKPLGLFPSATVGVTTSTVSVTADDIINLIYALKRPYRKSASFITNDQTLAVIRKLKDNNGAYLWQPSYQAGEPDRILGYAIHTSAYVPTIAVGQAVMSFGDYSYYNIGDRGSRSLQELKELFAGNGMIGYVMKERVDGKLILPEAVQLLKMKGTASA